MITIVDNEEMCIKVSESFVNNTKTPDSRPLSDYILEKTVEKFDLFRNIFNVKQLEKITFIIYDDVEEYRKYYKELNKIEPPEYARGSFDEKLNISYCVQHSNPMYNSSWWTHALSVNSHEAFHLYYKKYIYKEDRIVWFDEGMAQYLSGENDHWIFDDEKVKEEFNKFVEFYIPINNLNDRIQGNSNISDEKIFQRENVFNGYKASLLIILYMVETKGFEFLVSIMKDNNEIRKVGNTVIEEMVNYYLNKYNLE